MEKNLLTDFHAHILPNADHGSLNLETSAAQLRLIARSGVKRVVATPHFYPNKHSIETFCKKREKCARNLKTLPEKKKVITLIGAEVLVCEGLQNIEDLERLCIEGTKTILLEMPTYDWSEGLLETIDKINQSDLTPVMAHIDRYDPMLVESLLELGVKAQLNAVAFSSIFGRKRLMQYVSRGCVVALGSDLHTSRPSLYKPFNKACRLLGDALDDIMAKTDALLTPCAKKVARP